MEFGLPEKTLATLRGILYQYPSVEKAVIYGSRAKGNYRRGSDIDLTLLGDGLDHAMLSAIALELDDSDIPYTVDLSRFDTIENPNLREHIERVGKMLYAREPVPASFSSLNGSDAVRGNEKKSVFLEHQGSGMY